MFGIGEEVRQNFANQDVMKVLEFSMKVGDRIRVTAMKADGTPYRWWHATVESVSDVCIVARSYAGETVYEPSGTWQPRNHCRTYYWFDRPYNLSEVVSPWAGEWGLYVHIASPVQLGQGELRYHDYEMDVIKRTGQPPAVVDEDEFAEAAVRYGYSELFQARCRQAVAEALELVESWPVVRTGA